MQPRQYGVFSLPVIVGALGFFVDIYDLQVFAITRISSLKELGVPDAMAKNVGEEIIIWQMMGLVVGGLAWGVLGDKRGRKSVLFGSILLYSLATIANGFVQDITTYTVLRFIAGLGLAGELGASITLTSEMLPKEKRGISSAIIATSGVMGTIVAYFVHKLSNEDWRLCYYIGGGMGLLLLFLRMSVLDSGLYSSVKKGGVPMGNLMMLFTRRERFIRYFRAIIIGLPVWYVIGILITFSNEFAKQFGITDFDQPTSLMWQYVALAFGDMSAGFLANHLKSRKKTLYVYYTILTIFIILFFAFKGGGSATNMYLLCMGLGFGAGISVLYITMSAEQFGTNLRATAAISIPNLVRGFLLPMLLLFQFLRSEIAFNDYITAAWVVGIIVMICGWMAVYFTKETFGKELDFLESDGG
ncbi:MAG: MFS transporter [Chitinophagaceae bacterium]|nr:MFS transporter [Chitinophagaceae bacterium]